jgi:hypothetical protein
MQVPAIMEYLRRHGLKLEGTEVVDIGSYGDRSHPISVRLSPLTVKVTGDDKMTLEIFASLRLGAPALKSEAPGSIGRANERPPNRDHGTLRAIKP